MCCGNTLIVIASYPLDLRSLQIKKTNVYSHFPCCYLFPGSFLEPYTQEACCAPACLFTWDRFRHRIST